MMTPGMPANGSTGPAMTFFPSCQSCGCTKTGTEVFRCPVCLLLFCEKCGLALSVRDFTYCPRCSAMHQRDALTAGRIGPVDLSD